MHNPCSWFSPWYVLHYPDYIHHILPRILHLEIKLVLDKCRQALCQLDNLDLHAAEHKMEGNQENLECKLHQVDSLQSQICNSNKEKKVEIQKHSFIDELRKKSEVTSAHHFKDTRC